MIIYIIHTTYTVTWIRVRVNRKFTLDSRFYLYQGFTDLYLTRRVFIRMVNTQIWKSRAEYVMGI